MKKLMIYGLGFILFFLVSCTRSASEKNGTSVLIKIPSSHELRDKTQNFSSNNYVNKLIQSNRLQTMSSDPAPTGFEGTRPLNCFAVAVSGPTESLQKNVCYKTSTNPGQPVPFRAGILSAMVGAGRNIEFVDLESGPDRVFRLIGFHSKTGNCPSLAESENTYGNGYLIAENGSVNLPANATITVPMRMSYDSDKFVDRCEGPDFPDEGNGGGGDENSADRLVIRKDFFPANQIVEGSCQSVDIVGLNSRGSQASLESDVTFQLLGNGVPLPMFSSHQDCSANNSVNDLTMMAGQNRRQVWFLSGALNVAPVLDLNISFVVNPDDLLNVPLNGLQIRAGDQKSFDIYAPNRILAGSCYEFKLDAKYMNNSLDSSHYSSTNIAVDNGSAYSDASCSSVTSSVSFSTGQSSSSIFVRTSGSFGSQVKITASFSGFIDGEKIIEVGTGSPVLANMEVRYNNQTSVGDCVKATVTFLNDNYTAINLPAAMTLTMSGSGTLASFHNNQSCMSPNGGARGVAAGVSSAEFYFSPLVFGDQNIQLTAAGLPAFNLRYFANFQYKLLALPSAYSVSPGDCISVSISTRQQNGAPAFLAIPTNVNVMSPFPMFSDLMCQNSMGTTATILAATDYTVVYFLVDNFAVGPINRNLSFQAAGLSSNSFDLTVIERASLAPSWGLAAHKVPLNYPLDLKLFSVPFTGIGPFVYSKLAGTGSLVGDTYSPVASETASFTVSDSQASTLSFTAQTVQSVATNDFVAGQLPSGYNFARASIGKFFNSSGLLVDAGANVIRFDHDPDPSTGHAPLGVLIEPYSTNHTVHSSNLYSGTWIKTFANVVTSASILDPTGTTFSDALQWDNPTPTNMASAASQFHVPTSGVTYSGSVFVKKDTARFVGMKIHEDGSNYGYSGVVIDLDTGAVVGMIDPWNMTDISSNFGVQKLKNGWFRIWTNYVSKGGTSIRLYLYPVYHGGTTLTPYRDNSVMGRTYFWGAQLEVGDMVTSYIPTTTAAVSRSADSFIVNMPTSAPSYASASESTLRFEYSRPEGSRPFSGTLFTVCGGSCVNERLDANVYFGNMVQFSYTSVGGTESGDLFSGISSVRRGINKLAVSLSTESSYGFNFALNNSSDSILSTATNHPDFSGGNIYIGSDGSGLNQTAIHVRSYQLWTDKISGPGLRTMTKP